MPSQVNVNGLVTRRPGVYAKVDASALNNKELDINNVAIVGDFPFLEKAKPASATSVRGLAELQYSDDDLAMLASLLYNSASDDRVPGGPNKVYLVNTKTTTQANHTFNDSNGVASLVFKSKAWGVAGGRVFVTIGSGTTTGQKYTVIRDGRTEEFDDVGLEDVIKFKSTGGGLTSTVEFDPTSGLLIKTTKTGLNGNFTPVDMAFDGAIQITMSSQLAGAETVSLTISGINKATGSADTEVVAFANGDQVKTSTKSWSSVSSINSTVNAYAGTWTFLVNAFDLSIDSYTYAQDLVAKVNSADGYTAEVSAPQAGAIKLPDLDAKTSTPIQGALVAIDANRYAAVQALKNSSIVTVTAAAGADLEPANTAGSVSLSGGTESAAVLADWTTALESIETESIQIVAALPSNLLDVSGISGVHTAVRDHCKFMAGAGANERNCWLGATKDETLSALFARTKSLNSRFASLVFQDITVVDPTGASRTLDPSWTACLMAGMQSGTDIAIPLTRKRPNVVSADQNANIKPTQNANDLLSKGLCFFSKDRLGLMVERSITTYMTDDNPIYSEVSANESVNTSIRDLRNNLNTLIGDPAVITTASRIKTLTLARLNTQVNDGIIKAFVEASVVIEDLGDTFKVTYTMAAIEPINFIVVTAVVDRIAGTA